MPRIILGENETMNKRGWRSSPFYQRIKKKILLDADCKFEDRSKNAKIVVIILAGYKPFLWTNVFQRILTFSPESADVCLVSSGIYSTDLSDIAEKNQWSYLSLKRNNVCVSLNMAIVKFPCAEWIYKIDEDIFVTENFFNNTMNVFLGTEKEDSFYRNPVFVAPLIPINSFGYAYLIRQLHIEKDFVEKFGPIHIGGDTIVGSSVEFAKYMWGEGGCIPQLDELDRLCAGIDPEPIACPIHFSIGAILMHRTTWETMGYFTGWRGNGMGADEMQLCKHAVIYSSPMLVATNTCVGHLSFGGQNKDMKEYYLEHQERFAVKKPE